MKNHITKIIVAIVVCGAAIIGIAQSGLTQSAFFATGSQGALVQYVRYQQGLPVFGPASIIAPTTGTGFAMLKGSLVTTAATTNAVTITGVSTSSTCSISPTNAAGATNVATTYISAKAANTITVTHVATASLNYDLLCTPN